MNINTYHNQLTPEQIAAGWHREFVGGMWDEIGPLQLEFAKSEGLLPEHRIADVGCGALRAGVQLLPYLEVGHYYGLDINPSLIQAGICELEQAGLTDRKPNLLVNDTFALNKFAIRFDFALAQSLFTHLPMNIITRCLVETGRALKPGGKLLATFFKAPSSAFIEPWKQRSGIVTHYDQDPFHYSVDEMKYMGTLAGLEAEFRGEWGHPRNQLMMIYIKR